MSLLVDYEWQCITETLPVNFSTNIIMQNVDSLAQRNSVLIKVLKIKDG